MPRLRARELIRALERGGFAVIRSRSSHRRLKHPDGRVTTVPVHAGEEIGIGLLSKILRDVELTVDQLRDLLGR